MSLFLAVYHPPTVSTGIDMCLGRDAQGQPLGYPLGYPLSCIVPSCAWKPDPSCNWELDPRVPPGRQGLMLAERIKSHLHKVHGINVNKTNTQMPFDVV